MNSSQSVKKGVHSVRNDQILGFRGLATTRGCPRGGPRGRLENGRSQSVEDVTAGFSTTASTGVDGWGERGERTISTFNIKNIFMAKCQKVRSPRSENVLPSQSPAPTPLLVGVRRPTLVMAAGRGERPRPCKGEARVGGRVGRKTKERFRRASRPQQSASRMAFPEGKWAKSMTAMIAPWR